jgi:hypothetical protein
MSDVVTYCGRQRARKLTWPRWGNSRKGAELGGARARLGGITPAASAETFRDMSRIYEPSAIASLSTVPAGAVRVSDMFGARERDLITLPRASV